MAYFDLLDDPADEVRLAPPLALLPAVQQRSS
jgi:hypothetical protein